MSNIFGDWINSDDGPKFDDDFQGVTRTDGRNVERGDRDDLEAKREQDEIEESIKRIKESRRNFDLLYQQQLSEPRKPRRDEVEAKRLADARKSLDERRMQTARDEAQRGNYGRNYDPISGTTAGYVAPHEHGPSGSGLAKFSLIIITVLIVASAIFN